ncbi:MAG TPA: serine hydrolase domain-containing protein, partial [Burkholderiales bacterium]|nr:serine hydrolase domain-containing protein [Burkholderiales bacterium]
MSVSALLAAAVLGGAGAEAFVDASIKPALERSGSPGAYVVIVRDDETVLEKGYGIVDPQTTLLNIASIGKPMTALATLSIARDGKLDLDRDVNEYLGASGRDIHVAGPKLTLNNLLGHRAGFDANLTHLFVDLGQDASMSDAEINRRLVLLREPGVVNAYDNQGYGVVGLVLSAVTKQPFDQILRERVFEPLGMTRARYVTANPGGPDLAPCVVALGPATTRPCPYPVYRESLRGAGGIGATAHDMAQFMKVLLNQGRVDGRQAIAPELIADLTDFDRYRFHPGLPGVARSFTEINNTDRPQYSHSGHVPGFSSLMQIYPAAHVGILVAYMGGVSPTFDVTPSAGIDQLLHFQPQSPDVRKAIFELEGLADRIADQFVPKVEVPASAPVVAANTVAEPSATYLPASELSASLAGRVFRSLSAITVTTNDRGELFVGGAGPYRSIGADLYENADRSRIAFGERNGRRYLATGLSAAMWEEKPKWSAPAWTVAAFVIALLLWPTWLVYGRASVAPMLAWLVLIA